MNSLLDTRARGVYPISVTPFLDDGAIDLASMDRLVDFFLACKVPGLTLLGVLGEATRLTDQESLALLDRVIRRVNGRMQIIAGTSQAGFDNLRTFVAAAMGAGAAGIMVSPAPGLKTEEHIVNFFDTLIGRIGESVPIVLQDFPQNSGVFMSAETVGRLLGRFAGIKVLKHEESPALRKITRLRAQEQAGERQRVAILVGNSAIHLPQELHRGVDGANTGVAFPEMLVEVCRRFFAGDVEGAEDLYDIFLPLIRHEQPLGFGLAIRKEIFRRRGLIASARMRAPAPSLDALDHAELTRLLTRLDRRLREAGEAPVIASYPIGQAASA